jgi:Tol biopolymer transport system component
MRRILFLLTVLFILHENPLYAQYFGRNKPSYQKHEFKVTETEHFTIYDYLDNPEKLRELAAAAELWYRMHQAVLLDTFTEKNPLLIYNDHAGFQETNAIMGSVSVGTGGVTEGLRNRVIFPVAMTNQQTHHVLGHELVHAFQYHIVLNGDSTNMRNLANLPLWMVEGLAEYLSIGRIDPHTAMWMRDAVKHDALPKKLRDLDNSAKYFPYRWGQAFWAFVSGVYGDEMIKPLFVNTALYGLDPAIRRTLGTTPDSLNKAWTTTLKNHYGQWVTKDKKVDLPGKKLLSEDNFGAMNISPAISQNGKYLIFLSEKNLFSLDLYLADARTGKIIKKVASAAQDGHIDHFDFIESAGTWAPDEKRFAFDVYEQGRSTLIVKDVFKGKTLERITLDGVPEFNNPTWSPDGNTIVVSGLVNGQTDLFAYEVKTKKVRRLTNDRFAEILPAWSPDGNSLVFSTDELSIARGRSDGSWKMNLAVLDMVTGQTEMLDLFPNADNMNPQFDATGNIYFLSNRDGFRNLYYYDRAAGKVFQATDIETGISGITPYAPAIAVSGDRDRIVYTHYTDGGYAIYQARAADFELKEVDASAVNMTPAALPPFNPARRDVVNTNLRLLDNNLKNTQDTTIMKAVPYKPKFSLAYLSGGGGVGVATGNTSFGAASGLAGGIDMLFDDILGNNQLYAGLALNGEIQDAAGQFSYINNKGRIGWGASFSHIPFRSVDYYGFRLTPLEVSPGVVDTFLEEVLGVQRLFQERISAFAFYPLSITKRVEVGAAFEYYSTRTTEYSSYYNDLGILVASDRRRVPGSQTLGLANVNAAYVGDNSYFGFAAPLEGWRYRVGVEQYFGDFQFTSLLLDGRRYFRLRPVTLAVRGLGYGRFGGNSAEVFPFFLSNSWFVRGYGSNDLYTADPQLFNRMQGSKIAVGNIEIRLPLFGPKPLGLIKFFLPADLNLFVDGGVAFYDTDDLENPSPWTGVVHKPVVSVGASMRFNLFGALVVEPFYALPLSANKEGRQWRWGINILPGW